MKLSLTACRNSPARVQLPRRTHGLADQYDGTDREINRRAEIAGRKDHQPEVTTRSNDTHISNVYNVSNQYTLRTPCAQTSRSMTI